MKTYTITLKNNEVIVEVPEKDRTDWTIEKSKKETVIRLSTYTCS